MEQRFLPIWKPGIPMIEEMRAYLKARMIGQNSAIDEICNLFVARSVRTKDDRRPFLSVFLNGTSGVGKSLLFELIWQFLNERNEQKGLQDRIPVTKISLNGVYAFEMVEYFSWLSSGWRNPGDSKKSKMEMLYEKCVEVDPFYARWIYVLDEWEKLGPSWHWNDKIAFSSVSEHLEDAILTPKNPDGITMDFSNSIFVFTANYYCNSAEAQKRPIGFSVEDENTTYKDDPEIPVIDKEGIIDKLRKYFDVSAFNRIDKLIVFESLAGFPNLRRDYGTKEIESMFQTIDEFYSSKFNPVPSRERYGDKEALISEALEKSEPTWGFRAIKRYIHNTILWRILSLLHLEYPNLPRGKIPRRSEDTSVPPDMDSIEELSALFASKN